jgi:hypothetical protein
MVGVVELNGRRVCEVSVSSTRLYYIGSFKCSFTSTRVQNEMK